MSETKHTVEPWRRGEEHETKIEVLGGPKDLGWLVATVHGGRRNLMTTPDMEANFRRLVACINACAGIPTEALEAGTLAKVLDLADLAADEENLQVLAAALRALGRLP